MTQLILLIACVMFCWRQGTGTYILNSDFEDKNELSNGKSVYLMDSMNHEQQNITPTEKATCKCKNGDCVQEKKRTVCKCWPEYGQKEPDECIPCNCGKGSNCTVEDHWWYGTRITCVCKQGYKVKKNVCIEKNKCEDGSDTCPRDSTECVANGNDYYCNCLTGFKLEKGNSEKTNKKACIKITKCNDGSDRCPLDSTQCIPTDDDFYCKCKTGYKLDGINVENENKKACKKITKCDDGSATCPLDSTECVPTNDDFYCKCKEGYKLESPGSENENKNACIKITKCNDGSDPCPFDSTQCIPRNDDFYCKCKVGYKLDGIDEEHKNKEACKKETCDCGEHSYDCQLNKQGLKICRCFQGYGQTGGVCSAICRSNKDCLNGGVCKYEERDSFCKCRDHFKGNNCEINEICESLNVTCNAIGAVCTYFEWLKKGFCECPPTKTYNRKLKMCEEICQPISCIHGKCEVKDYQQKCRCDDGYEGIRCEKKILPEADNTGYIIAFGILCAACPLFTTFTLIIYFGRLRKSKQ